MDDVNSLYILWTNADLDTSLRMVMMYATNSMARGWWENMTVIVWGATQRLVVENEQVQEAVKVAQNTGVKFTACLACARQLGVVEQLEALDIEVVGWGEPLTRILKNNERLITI